MYNKETRNVIKQEDIIKVLNHIKQVRNENIEVNLADTMFDYDFDIIETALQEMFFAIDNEKEMF